MSRAALFLCVGTARTVLDLAAEGSSAELTKVMVGVEVGEAQPILLRHFTEVGVKSLPCKISWLPRDAA